MPYAENLVESGGGETYSGWSIDEGSWGTTLGGDCSEAPEPTSGSKFLVVGSLCEGGGSGGKDAAADGGAGETKQQL